MRKPKYTRGPWAVVLEKSDSGQPCASVVSTTAPHDYFPDCHKAITGWGCVLQSVPDARLIAAAPEMYETLKRWQKFAKANGWTDADYHDSDGTGWISLTKDVLAKAVKP